MVCTASCSTADFTLSSGLSARLVLRCTKHTSIILALSFLLVYFPGSYHSSCKGAEWKLIFADLPEVACTSLLNKNRQMGEQKSSSVSNNVMVIQYFKISKASLYASYSLSLLWTISSLREELPIFSTFCTVVPYVNTVDPSSDCDPGSIPG